MRSQVASAARCGERVWPPQRQVEVDDWRIGDVRVGDLVFSSKSNGADFIQRVNDFSGHPWRHVASVVDDGGELHVVEIDKNSFGYRPLRDFVESFDRCGVARLGLDPACVAKANAWMQSKVEDEHVYAWDDLFLAGLLALITRGIFVRYPAQVRSALHGAYTAAKAALESGAVDSFTCSGFIQCAYDAAGGRCGIVHDAWRQASTWPPRITLLDDLLGDDHGQLAPLFADATLLELYERSLCTQREGDWRPNWDQVGELVRVVASAVGGWRNGAAPAQLSVDGRWVTPSDLWTSPSVIAKGLLASST